MEEQYEIVELSTGAEVKCKAIPPLLIMDFYRDNPVPKPPIKERELDIKKDSGEPYTEKYEDPQDPEFQRQTREWMAERGRKLNEIYLVLGTEIELPDDDEWLEPLRFLGILPKEPENEYERKLFYIRYHLVKDPDDITRMREAIYSLTWPSEEEVKAIGESFPGQVSE